MRKLLFFICFLLTSGCQYLHTKPTESFYLNNTQTTHLKLSENLDARLFNSAPPLITEDKVVTGNAQDGIRVFTFSGNELWKKQIDAGIESGFAYKGNRLYFGANDYKFYSLNLESGIEVWNFKTEGEVLSRPLLYNDRIYFVTANNILYCLHAKDGTLAWRYKRNTRDAFTVRGAATPVIHQNRLFVGFSDGFFTAINLSNGSLIWERNLATNLKFKDVDASAVLDGETIYVSAYDSALYALNSKEGRVLWSIEAGSSYPVTIANNKIYYSTSDSRLLIIEKQTGKVITEKYAKGIFQTAQVKDNLLFLADSAGPLKVFDSNRDKELAEFYPGHGISSPLTMSTTDKSIYFLSFGANLFQINYGWKPQLGAY